MNNIFVTQPSLPPFEEMVEYLKDIWDSKWLTNNGKYHKLFEEKLTRFLNVPYVSLFANGTLALVSALQTLRITGEVITTPYSFVATTHSLNWNGITPVFADISPHNYNLTPKKIEATITPKTTAIMPVHVYGNPCNVEEIQRISDMYGLKVIYDAAHAFGVNYKNVSVLNFGDLSVLSFHATKVFNTFEGGAIISHDLTTKKRIDYLKNFGFADEVTVVGPGINAKMNEFQAALGVLQLEHIENAILKRRKIDHIYRKGLSHVDGISFIEYPNDVEPNYAYFPIFIKENFPVSRNKLYDIFRGKGIYVRRYFYPLISQMPTYRGLRSAHKDNLPVAEQTTREVLCLPIYPDLTIPDVYKVIEIINSIGMSKNFSNSKLKKENV